jgi:integrase
MQHPSYRRHKTRHVGVYWRQTARGRAYVIGYPDRDGTWRFKTLPHGSGLEDARKARAEIVGKSRSERPAPSKLTLAEVAKLYLAEPHLNLRASTLAKYRHGLEGLIVPRLGKRKVADTTPQDVARVVGELTQAGYAAWTVRAALVALSRVFEYAAERGWATSSPVKGLRRGDRPKLPRSQVRTLDPKQVEALIEATAPRYRALVATGLFTGVRVSEALGLTWADVDFKASRVRVRMQLDRLGPRGEPKRVAPKTQQAQREVVLMRSLGALLREHKAASKQTEPGDFVFAHDDGRPLDHRHVSDVLRRAVMRAKLDDPNEPRLTFHSLRDAFASMLIAEGADVVFLSRQLGHSSPDITLKVYAGLFDAQRHADSFAAKLEDGYGAIVAKTRLAGREQAPRGEALADVVTLHGRESG